MFLRILVVAAAVLGPALPAAAAPAPTDPAQRCRDLLDRVAYKPVGTPAEGDQEDPSVGTVTPIGETGCRYTDVLVGGHPDIAGGWSPQWKIESLVVDRVDFGRSYADGLPLTLSVRADGIRNHYSRRMPADIAYQLKLVQAPVGIALDYTYDPSSDTLTLEKFSFGNDRIGRLSVTASVAGLDPGRIDPDRPPGSDALSAVSLKSLTVDFDNRGMFEIYALLPMLKLLPDGQDDPEVAVAAAKEQAAAGLALLTAAGVPEPTVAALGRFIQAMPQPRGPLHLAVAPQPPVAIAEVAEAGSDDPAKLAALLKRLNLTASY